MPLGGELLPQIEQPQGGCCTISTEMVPQMGNGALLKRAGIFPRRVLEVQDGVGNRAVIELAQRLTEVGVVAVIVKKLQRPLANDAGSFEGQVAFVPETQFEDAAVVLGMAGGDRARRNTVFDKAGIVGGVCRCCEDSRYHHRPC